MLVLTSSQSKRRGKEGHNIVTKRDHGQQGDKDGKRDGPRTAMVGHGKDHAIRHKHGIDVCRKWQLNDDPAH